MPGKTQAIKTGTTEFSKETYLYWYELMQLIRQFEQTAEEKYKKLLDGTTARYVYYGCTRSRDINCKAGYIREDELIDQLVGIIDKMDINEIGMRHKFDEEVARLTKFQKGFFGEANMKKQKNIDLRGYAKYLLREGSVIEKRELLACVKSKLILTQKVLTLERSSSAD